MGLWDYYQDVVTDVQNAVAGVTGHNKFERWDKVQEKANPGDLIEFCRGAYNHWAMMSDDGVRVYNICAEDKSHTTALIKLESLKVVCKRGPSEDRQRARVNNKDGFRGLLPHASTGPLTPLSPEESIELAEEVVDTYVEYSFTGKNCEYYCTSWKFGKGFTDQAYSY